MLKAFVLTAVIFTGGIKCHAQNDTIAFNTDRPGQSINPYTAGDGVLQFQTGYTYFNSSTRSRDYQLHGGDVQAKLGICERLEFSFALGAGWERRDFFGEVDSLDLPFAPNENDMNSGLSMINVSARYLIREGDGLKPAIGVQVGYTASGEPGGGLDLEAFNVILAAQSNLTDRISLTANFIYAFRDDLAYTFNWGYALTDDLGVFAEYYRAMDGNWNSERNIDLVNSYLNLGAFWQLGDDFQIDLAGGFDLDEETSRARNTDQFYIQAGFTKRFLLGSS